MVMVPQSVQATRRYTTRQIHISASSTLLVATLLVGCRAVLGIDDGYVATNSDDAPSSDVAATDSAAFETGESDSGVPNDTSIDSAEGLEADVIDAAGGCPAAMKLVAGGSFSSVAADAGGVVGALCVDVHEVTMNDFAACVTAGKCPPSGSGTPAEPCNANTTGRSDHPVNCVDWSQAGSYCVFVAKRLPTELEWEWAARGRTAANGYTWGSATPTKTDAPERLCWSAASDRLAAWPGIAGGTCVAGSHAIDATPDGLLDMAGNVTEWTTSLRSGFAEYVQRGGNAFSSFPAEVSVAARSASTPSRRSWVVGFRCVREP